MTNSDQVSLCLSCIYHKEDDKGDGTICILNNRAYPFMLDCSMYNDPMYDEDKSIRRQFKLGIDPWK